MDASDIIGRVSIASPCSADWSQMTGDERARFCGSCSKFVYDFSALTTVEISELIRSKGGRLCARIYRRRDGRMLTADCPVGVRRRRRRNLAAIALAGLGLTLANVASAFRPVGGGYCAKGWSGRLASAIGRVFHREPESLPTMGEMVIDPSVRRGDSESGERDIGITSAFRRIP